MVLDGMREKRCTECCGSEEPETMQKHEDAADVEHWFHPGCWKRFCRWANALPGGQRKLAGEP